jgi:hypothetical protein
VKTQTIKREFPLEISGVPGMILTISVSVRKEMIGALDAVGVGAAELPNMQKKLLQEAIDAVDGTVPGLIVSNLED